MLEKAVDARVCARVGQVEKVGIGLAIEAGAVLVVVRAGLVEELGREESDRWGVRLRGLWRVRPSAQPRGSNKGRTNIAIIRCAVIEEELIVVDNDLQEVLFVYCRASSVSRASDCSICPAAHPYSARLSGPYDSRHCRPTS